MAKSQATKKTGPTTATARQPATRPAKANWPARLAALLAVAGTAAVAARFVPVSLVAAVDANAAAAMRRQRWCRAYEKRHAEHAAPSAAAVADVVERARAARNAVPLSGTKEDSDTYEKLRADAQDAAAALETREKARAAEDSAFSDAASVRAEASISRLVDALDAARMEVSAWQSADGTARKSADDALYAVYRTEEALRSMDPPNYQRAFLNARRFAKNMRSALRRVAARVRENAQKIDFALWPSEEELADVPSEASSSPPSR